MRANDERNPKSEGRSANLRGRIEIGKGMEQRDVKQDGAFNRPASGIGYPGLPGPTEHLRGATGDRPRTGRKREADILGPKPRDRRWESGRRMSVTGNYGKRGNKWEKLGNSDRKVGNHGKFREKPKQRVITFKR